MTAFNYDPRLTDTSAGTPSTLRQIAAPHLHLPYPMIPLHVRPVSRYILAWALTHSIAQAVPLKQGEAFIDYEPLIWASLAADTGYPTPVFALAAFLDQTQANSLTYSEVLAASQLNPNYQGQRYTMNGSTVTNLTGRTTQPTTFSYSPEDPTQSGGVIGLGGIARFIVSGGGSLLFGDFTFGFDPARLSRGGSGWFLKGNIPPAAVAFDLLDVRIVSSPSSLEVSGNLGVSFEVANFLFATPSDALRSVGHFKFIGSTQSPITSSPTIRRIEFIDNLVRVHCIEGPPKGSFQIVRSSDLSSPLASWTVVAQGTFDDKGENQTETPRPIDDATGWYQLRLP